MSILSREEVERRLEEHREARRYTAGLIGRPLLRNDAEEALQTAKQLGEWLEALVEFSPLRRYNSEARLGARAWLSGQHSEGEGR